MVTTKNTPGLCSWRFRLSAVDHGPEGQGRFQLHTVFFPGYNGRSLGIVQARALRRIGCRTEIWKAWRYEDLQRRKACTRLLSSCELLVLGQINENKARAAATAAGGLSLGVKAQFAGQIARCIGEVPHGAERMADVITALENISVTSLPGRGLKICQSLSLDSGSQPKAGSRCHAHKLIFLHREELTLSRSVFVSLLSFIGRKTWELQTKGSELQRLRHFHAEETAGRRCSVGSFGG